MAKIVIDLETCTVAGECIYNHPAYFEWSDDDRPLVKKSEIETDDDRLHAEQAVAVCPSGAISIVE